MWNQINNSLHAKFTFKDFDEAFEFMGEVSKVAKKLNHHPKWTNEWNIVEFWLSTHDQDNSITPKDRELADDIEAIYQNYINKDVTTSSTSEDELRIYTDGGSRGNPGPSASGFVIKNSNEKVIFNKGVYLGIATNNQAEYLALKFAIEKALTYKPKKLVIFMDSLLIINQMKGTFKIKNQDLLKIYNDIKGLLEKVDEKTFTHIPRELNKLADTEVNIALDKALA
jgi:ribonuclease HI